MMPKGDNASRPSANWQERGYSKPGRKPLERRQRYLKKYGIEPTHRPARKLPSRLMDQLDACKDEAARRVLLGIGRKRA